MWLVPNLDGFRLPGYAPVLSWTYPGVGPVWIA